MSKDRVLVTGASGFIAKHCIAELLRSGYAVRGSVRSLARRAEIEKAVERAGVSDPDIELVEADLMRDAGWADAAADCRFVLHLASPFPSKEPRNPDDLIKPARDGTLRVFNAAAEAGVERIVQTSSVVAVMYSAKPEHLPRTEEDWTDTANPIVATYARSKTLAERAAWDAAAGLAEATPMAFCTVNPGLVLGPALDTDLSTSHEPLRLLGRGLYRAIPKVSFPVVDVRDVARHHVIAMTHPKAPGRRWLSCNGTLSVRQIGELMVEQLPDIERKVPTIELPDAMVRFAANFASNLKSVRSALGRANLCDNRATVDELGVTFRPPDEAVKSAAQSLRELGVI